MSKINAEHLKHAGQFMTALWSELMKPYYEPEGSDSYWDDVVSKMNEIGKRYCDGDERLRKILTGFVDGLDKELKR